ncbi:flavonol synthase [Suhomyces tanzawaensis NRRL Y-17324]|uniref:Flavonol synthase n=1 Tax=Suhomyces tanzawaensis NRRL Y-17324 TaxID=984487 RepID=A0A1E4SPC2_9ASCO|nr:flavonol synthase [Suhomyces tanzawaensis NRRL Y-17324]ODV81371.1 flavonol synthase [Suhomyces tanzawaensis NRRL Y-17324]
MTVDTPQPQPWILPPETNQQLDWAELVLVDLSKWDQPGGKQELAETLKHGSSHDGFWAVTNSGISEEEIFEIFAYGKHFFDDYTLEQKRAVEVDFASGNYFGYKPIANKALFGTEVRDNLETFNIAKFTLDGRFSQYHANDFIQNHQRKLEHISRKAFGVADKLLRLFALILELDEDYFVSRHLYDDPSDDSLRYIKYTPRTAEDDAQVENIWSRAHTDFGTLTLLFNQVVAGLQIKLSTGEWKYVKPVLGGIICNVGDTLNFWSGGYFKTTIHRVVRPPQDQIDAPRIGAFYFVRPGDNAEIEVAPLPLLKRLGLYRETKPIGGTEYVRKRVQDYHNREGYEKRNEAKFRVGEFEINDGFD